MNHWCICFLWVVVLSGTGLGTPAWAVDHREAVPTLVVCLPSPVETLDPTDYRDRETQIALNQMFDSLTRRDSDLKVVPHLAESFRAVSDTEWEFKLKRGLTFHNGEPLTADDVRFTFERIIGDGAVDGHTSSRKSLFGPLSGIRVLNNHTLRFTTRSPWPILPLMMSLQAIVPEEYMKRVGTRGFQALPVGSGIYRFVEMHKDGGLVLTRFHPAGKAMDRNVNGTVERLVITWEPDVIKRIAMIKRGEAGLITQIPPDFLSSITLNPAFRVISQPGTRSYFGELNCRKKPFDDPRVRCALNYAMDMSSIITTVLHGKGQALPTVLLPRAFGYNPALHPYAFVPEKGRALLKEAGFPSGYTVRIWCEPLHETFANAMAYYLLRIGIQSRVITGDRQAVRQAMTSGSADIMVSSWGNATLDPVGIVLPKFHSKGAGNYSGYSNPKVDALLDHAERTMDRATREKDYQAVQKIVYDDAPMIFGYSTDEFHVIRTGIDGVTAGKDGMLDLSRATMSAEGHP